MARAARSPTAPVWSVLWPPRTSLVHTVAPQDNLVHTVAPQHQPGRTAGRAAPAAQPWHPRGRVPITAAAPGLAPREPG